MVRPGPSPLIKADPFLPGENRARLVTLLGLIEAAKQGVGVAVHPQMKQYQLAVAR